MIMLGSRMFSCLFLLVRLLGCPQEIGAHEEKHGDDDNKMPSYKMPSYLARSFEVKETINTEMDRPVKAEDINKNLPVPTMDDKDIIRMILGDDNVPTAVSKQKIPSEYVRLLFEALLESDQHEIQSANFVDKRLIPTVTAYKAYFVHTKSKQTILFVAHDIDKKNVSRMEIALKVDEQLDGADNIGIAAETSNGTFETLEGIEAQRDGDYLVLDVSRVTTHVVFNQLRIPSTLYIAGSSIRIRHKHDPVLVVYENLKENPSLSRAQRIRRGVDRFPYHENVDNVDDHDSLCRRRDWDIDMTMFRWEWYWVPESYNAGYCSGDCLTPLVGRLNSTNYSFLKNLFHQKTYYMNQMIPTACCTPISYHPQTIFYTDVNGNHIMKTLPEMSIASCGCR